MSTADGVALEAGRELDERIAVEVMGLTVIHDAYGSPCLPGNNCGTGGWDDIPHKTHGPWIRRYSTDIAAAFEVVDRLTSAGLRVGVVFRGEKVSVVVHDDTYSPIVEAESPTFPLAICRAALHPEVLEYLERPRP